MKFVSLTPIRFPSSAFHLSYNMLLNQIRCEDGDPENLLRNSFYQFQADRAIPDLEVSCFELDWLFPSSLLSSLTFVWTK